jgi:hypothetical protein
MLARTSQIKIAFGTVSGTVEVVEDSDQRKQATDAVDTDTPLDSLSATDRIRWLGGLTSNLLEECLGQIMED